MAAVTPSFAKDVIFQNGYLTRLVREYGTSAANSADTFTTTLSRPKRLKAIRVCYSAAPTYTTDITVNLDAGLGAAFDQAAIITIETTGSTQDVHYLPGATTAIATGQVPLGAIDFVFAANDQIVINLPAGGAGITAAVVVYWEELR